MKHKKKILLLGGNSYIAKEFLKIYSADFEFIAIKRDNSFSNYFDLTEDDFKDIDTVINFTAIVHQKDIESKIYFDVNFDLAIFLAETAKKTKVKQFIQLSTIAVYGDEVSYIDSKTKENPSTAYGKSKLKADKYLLNLIDENFKVAIVRPPMVYGFNAPGNMKSLSKLIGTHLPLPLKNFTNKRSFIYIENLLNLIYLLVQKKSDGIFLVKDKEDVSIGELSLLIKNKRKSKSILFPFPLWLLNKFITKSGLLRKLYGNLVINDSLTEKKLGRYAMIDFKDGISNMLIKEKK